jgi:hypothetical protein
MRYNSRFGKTRKSTTPAVGAESPRAIGIGGDQATLKAPGDRVRIPTRAEMAMDINSAFNAGLSGLQSAQQRLDRSAEAIARNSGGLAATTTTETALVQAAAAERQGQASTLVVRAADEALGSLIDLRA